MSLPVGAGQLCDGRGGARPPRSHLRGLRSRAFGRIPTRWAQDVGHVAFTGGLSPSVAINSLENALSSGDENVILGALDAVSSLSLASRPCFVPNNNCRCPRGQ